MPVQNHDTVTIAAVGDIMLGSSYPDSTRLPPDSARGSFKFVHNQFKGANIVFGNLEGTLLDSGNPSTFKKRLDRAYLFRMPTYYGRVLSDAGFNLLSLANNHITDFGETGDSSTTNTLRKFEIHYAGLLACSTSIFKTTGIRYGFCAFSPNANVVQLLDLANARKLVADLKSKCDIVIVSFHGGAEGPAYEHVPFVNESYLGTKRGNVVAFAHTVIDAGADLVLGNGPHVSRAMERYKERLIAYSLGNFCTYKSVSVIGVCGLAPLLKVNLNKKGEFLNGQIISYTQTHADGLLPDSLNKVAARIRMLTEKDFPSSGLVIDADGRINKKTQPLAAKL